MSYNCLICAVETTTSTALSVHLKRKHRLTSEKYYLKYVWKDKAPVCLQCGKLVKFQSISKGYRSYCSTKCSALASEKQKQQTCLERYGVRKPLQLKDFLKKSKHTLLQHYGVTNPMKDAKLRSKQKRTNLKRFGVENPKQSEMLKTQLRGKYIQRILPVLQKDLEKLNLELKDCYNDLQTPLSIKCKICGAIFETRYFYLRQGYGFCPCCYPKYKSVAEVEVGNFIETTLSPHIVLFNNKDIIFPLELDIFIPYKNIAIEYNGLYWHSEALGRDKNYHLNKLNLCSNKNITLIQIFEDEWIFKQDIVKHRLKQILGVNNSQRIHARSCTIKEIPSKIKNEFLTKYHLQGMDNSSLSLGLFYKEQLVAVMTFNHGSLAKGVKKKDNLIWELNRYCCDYAYHIPGTASKLLSFFKKNYKWKKIYSYADRRWSVGNMYYKLGFALEKETLPNYWYTKGLKRIHRFALRKRENESREIPEYILRTQEGYTRIWDCGNLKFTLSNCKN